MVDEKNTVKTNGTQSEGNKAVLNELVKVHKFRKIVDQRADFHQNLETKRG